MTPLFRANENVAEVVHVNAKDNWRHSEVKS
jgi:hypothetical protein